MATVQKLPISTMSTASSYGSCRVDGGVPDQFPAGLRVLVVDDDTTCLRILEQMLRKCLYQVTTCCQATIALSLLRERKGGFDVVISDVHMPDMDGFKLLEHVGLEMDLPVIMMSADGRTSAVMRGVKHGACDYLIKPVRIEELKNIWQHVFRKKWNDNKEVEHSGSMEDSEKHRRGGEDAEYASSLNEGTDGSWKFQRKRRDSKDDEDDGELDNDDPSASKKPRVVWSVELHQQFVSAVNQLGIDKAVPKRILELMNVPGLTRENVASHLQKSSSDDLEAKQRKFRLYLKRLSGAAQHQGVIASPFCGSVESNGKLGPLGRLDIQALAAAGQITPQTLATLHAELLGRPTGSLVLPTVEQPVLLQPSLQGPKNIAVDHGVAFGQPILKCQSISKQFPQPNVAVEDISSGFTTWPSNYLGAVGPSSGTGSLSAQNNNVLEQILQQQRRQQQQHQQLQQQPVLSDSSHAISVQPSCQIVPQSSNSFQSGNISVSLNQNTSFSGSSVVDYSFLSTQSNNVSLGVQQVSDGDIKNVGVFSGYSVPGVSISTSGLSCPVRTDNIGWQVENPTMNVNPASQLSGLSSCETAGSYATRTSVLSAQGQRRNLGFVGKGTSFPSQFAVDDMESPMGELVRNKPCVDGERDRVKQELNLDFVEAAKAGMLVLRHLSPNDLMGVLSK